MVSKAHSVVYLETVTKTRFIALIASQVTSLPSSPAELLRHIQSDGYKQAQIDQVQRVRGSFEVRNVKF